MPCEPSALDPADSGAVTSRDPDIGPKVGLVVVSHSRTLAGAAVALAMEMVHGERRDDRSRRRSRRDDVRNRCRHDHGGDRTGSRPGRRRRPDGSRQRPAQHRAGAGPAARLLHPRGRHAVARAHSSRVSSSRPWPRRAEPAREEVAAEARAALMGKSAHLSLHDEADDSVPVRRGECGECRGLHGRQPPRAARPTGRPTRQRSTGARRDRQSSQPQHRCRTGAGRKPEPGCDPGGAARAPGGGPSLRASGRRGGGAHPRSRQAPVRRGRQ